MQVPTQHIGDTSNAVHSVNTSGAKDIYERAKERLLSVNEWEKICGPHSAKFQLMDGFEKPLFSKAVVGNYMKIDLPGTTKSDWVVIEEIVANDSPSGNSNYIMMRVRPIENAHFYESTATSSFIVERIGTRITAGVYGRNEVPNVKENKLRNLLISIGTFLGFQKPQWKSLVTGLLK
jgi:hypothetical protein